MTDRPTPEQIIAGRTDHPDDVVSALRRAGYVIVHPDDIAAPNVHKAPSTVEAPSWAQGYAAALHAVFGEPS